MDDKEFYNSIIKFKARTVDEFIDESIERNEELCLLVVNKTLEAIRRDEEYMIYDHAPNVGITLMSPKSDYPMVLWANIYRLEELEEYELCQKVWEIIKDTDDPFENLDDLRGII